MEGYYKRLMFNFVMFTFLSAAFQEKKLLNDITLQI